MYYLLMVVFIPAVALTQGTGLLRVSGINPRYLVSEADTTKAVWLGGFHLWGNAQDGGNNYPPAVVNMRKYWDSLSANRNNFVRLWAGWEQAAGLIETADSWYWEPLPFKRTGPGNAHDGRLRFNLDSLNDAFYARMYTYCDSLRLRGMYVAVQLFDGWSNAYPNHGFSAGNPWYYHPYNSANNANSVNGDPNGDGSGLEVHSSPYNNGGGVLAVWNRQWKYIQKFLDTLNALDNIMWEVCNEAEGQGQYAWHRLVIDSIHAYESRKPKQHVVWHSGDWGILNDSLFAGPAEVVAPGAGNNGTLWQTNPPDMGGSKVVIVDTDHLWGMVSDHQVPWVWKNFCNGNSVTLQDNFCSNPAYPYWDCDNVNWPPFRRAMGVAIGLANTADLLHMTPQPDKSSTSDFVLFGSATGEVIIYQQSGNITVDLTDIVDSLDVFWFDPDDFVSTSASRTAGGTFITFSPPNTRYDVLYLVAAASAPLSPILFLPPNGSTLQPVDLQCRWYSSTGATSYHYQLSLSPLFSSTLVNDSLLTDTTRQVSGLATATTYYWRVRSRNSLGQSTWSSVWNFATGSSGTTQILQMINGWNLISVPLTVPDGRTISLFPTATSHSFSYAFGRGYQFEDTLLNGVGYWLKFGGAQNVSVTGLLRTHDTVIVASGWNIIGSISLPVDTSTIQSIPPGIRISHFYEYASGYTAAASIEPGKGYWVKATAPGLLILLSGTSAQPVSVKPLGTDLLHKK